MDNKYLKESYSSIGIKLGGCSKKSKKSKKTYKKVRSKKIKRNYKIIKFSSLLK